MLIAIYTPKKNGNLTTTLRDGGDNPCTSSYPISKYFLWSLFQGDYELAAQTVTKRINYNRVGGEYGYYNHCFPFITGLDSNCAQLSQVACIMNAYYNEVMATAIPEYDPSNLYKTTKTPARIAADTEIIIKHITTITGQAYFRVKEVLEHLYWATYGDTSDRISYQYISPLQYKNNKGKLEKAPDMGSGVTAAGDAVTGAFDDILTVGKWVLILGGIGLGLYLAAPLFTALKSK